MARGKQTKKSKPAAAVKRARDLVSRKKLKNACVAKHFTRVERSVHALMNEDLKEHTTELIRQAVLLAQMDGRKMPSRAHARFAIKVTPASIDGFFA